MSLHQLPPNCMGAIDSRLRRLLSEGFPLNSLVTARELMASRQTVYETSMFGIQLHDETSWLAIEYQVGPYPCMLLESYGPRIRARLAEPVGMTRPLMAYVPEPPSDVPPMATSPVKIVPETSR